MLNYLDKLIFLYAIDMRNYTDRYTLRLRPYPAHVRTFSDNDQTPPDAIARRFRSHPDRTQASTERKGRGMRLPSLPFFYNHAE